MVAVTATAQMTAEEFLAIGEDQTSRRLQLIDGELVMSEPTWKHNGVQIAIAASLRTWARAAPARGCAGLPLDVQLDDRNVYAPDVVWYREGRAPPRNDPPTPAPSRDAVVAPTTNGTSASRSDARPSPSAASVGSHSGYTRPSTRDDAGGTIKTRGLKRLIAAVRRL